MRRPSRGTTPIAPTVNLPSRAAASFGVGKLGSCFRNGLEAVMLHRNGILQVWPVADVTTSHRSKGEEVIETGLKWLMIANDALSLVRF
jgi:hypothetical protein